MTRRPGSRKNKARPPDSSTAQVRASGRGAAAIGGDVSGIVSTGSNVTNLQLGDVFLNVDAARLAVLGVDEDRLSRGSVVVGDVPQRPRAFQPRQDLMARFDAHQTRTSVVCAMTGMRGVGKTQLAAAYARARIDAGWRLVAWVDADNPASVLAGLGSVAASLGMSTGSADAAAVAAMVRHWLETDGHDCLVVFDNANDLDGLRAYLPAAGAAEVVITSTRQGARNLGPVVEVDVFTEEETLAFLAARTGLSDDTGARQLAAEMGWLPLGLAQAAAVIAKQRLSYGTYTERLRAVRLDDYLERVEGDTYPHRVAEAVMLSLEAAEAADVSGAGRGVMNLLALLSPAGVSRAILHAAAAMGVISAATEPTRKPASPGSESEPIPAERADAAIGRLADWSLLTFSVNGSAIMAHRLIKRVVRELRMADGTYAALAELAGHLLANLGDAMGARVWEHPAEASELVGHVTALHDHVTGRLDDTSAPAHVIRSLRLWALWLVNTLGDRPAVAISIGVPLTAEYERVLGADHFDTLMSCNNLATALQAAGRLDEATLLFERTLADRERVLGTHHPMTLTSRNNLAGAYREAGRVDEAISLYEMAVASRERVLGQDDPETLATRSNLALTYHQAGRHDAAVSLLERTLADGERALGGAEPRTLTLRNNLACAYLETGRPDDGLALLTAVLTDRERVLGPGHPDTLASRISLAFAMQVSGSESEAISVLERALTDSEQVLGADHPMTLTARLHLAVSYQQAGRLGEALPRYERTAADAERLLGSGDARHPETINSRNNLAVAYGAAGKLDQAIALLETTLADSVRVLGTDHPATLRPRANLASAHFDAGQPGEAIRLLEQARLSNERMLGADHLNTLASRTDLAVAYWQAGRRREAISLFERTLADSERILGADHPFTKAARDYVKAAAAETI